MKKAREGGSNKSVSRSVLFAADSTINKIWSITALLLHYHPEQNHF